ncbi:hypothetical protein E2C01_001515 [Portunus trituberculatus]|uniref:Uncharacterized protein n=1 Tax=Portunus trituberculatus TaxID=210409 RepID=A0A5B7CHD0_PORTR|nr:hypothetical protein [Portunus trituberculatus]
MSREPANSGPSEHLTKSTSSLANTQTAENSLDSPRTGLSSAALASPSTCFLALNDSASSVGEISVPLALFPSGGRLVTPAQGSHRTA